MSSPKYPYMDAISQNLSFSDEKLRLLVLGDKNVGKTHFISNYMKVLNGETLGKDFHSTTNSLEINKKLVKISNKLISLELWDTNRETAISSVFKSYLKICDGLVLMCDVNCSESFKFIDNQLERINGKLNRPKVLVLFSTSTKKKHKLKDCIPIKYLKEKYNAEAKFVDLDQSITYTTIFSQFLHHCLESKHRKSNRLCFK